MAQYGPPGPHNNYNNRYGAPPARASQMPMYNNGPTPAFNHQPRPQQSQGNYHMNQQMNQHQNNNQIQNHMNHNQNRMNLNHQQSDRNPNHHHPHGNHHQNNQQIYGNMSPRVEKCTDIGWFIVWIIINLYFTVMGIMGFLEFGKIKKDLNLPDQKTITHKDALDMLGYKTEGSFFKGFIMAWPAMIFIFGGVMLAVGIAHGIFKLLGAYGHQLAWWIIYFGWLIFLAVGSLFGYLGYEIIKVAVITKALTDDFGNWSAMFMGSYLFFIGCIMLFCVLAMLLFAVLTAIFCPNRVVIIGSFMRAAGNVFGSPAIGCKILSLGLLTNLINVVFMTFFITMYIGCAFATRFNDGDSKAMEVIQQINQILGALTLMWNMNVIFNTSHVAYCKTITKWYTNGAGKCDPASLAPCKYYAHAWSTHIGSICFGSFVVALFRLLSNAANNNANNHRNGNPISAILTAIIAAIMGAMADMIEWFNSIALVRVAGKNETFCEAVKGTAKMFSKNGLGLVINNIHFTKVLTALALMSFAIQSIVVMGGGVSLFLEPTYGYKAWQNKSEAFSVDGFKKVSPGYYCTRGGKFDFISINGVSPDTTSLEACNASIGLLYSGLAIIITVVLSVTIVMNTMYQLDSAITAMFVNFAENPTPLKQFDYELAQTIWDEERNQQRKNAGM